MVNQNVGTTATETRATGVSRRQLLWRCATLCNCALSVLRIYLCPYVSYLYVCKNVHVHTKTAPQR